MSVAVDRENHSSTRARSASPLNCEIPFDPHPSIYKSNTSIMHITEGLLVAENDLDDNGPQQPRQNSQLTNGIGARDTADANSQRPRSESSLANGYATHDLQFSDSDSRIMNWVMSSVDDPSYRSDLEPMAENVNVGGEVTSRVPPSTELATTLPSRAEPHTSVLLNEKQGFPKWVKRGREMGEFIVEPGDPMQFTAYGSPRACVALVSPDDVLPHVADKFDYQPYLPDGREREIERTRAYYNANRRRDFPESDHTPDSAVDCDDYAFEAEFGNHAYGAIGGALPRVASPLPLAQPSAVASFAGSMVFNGGAAYESGPMDSQGAVTSNFGAIDPRRAGAPYFGAVVPGAGAVPHPGVMGPRGVSTRYSSAMVPRGVPAPVAVGFRGGADEAIDFSFDAADTVVCKCGRRQSGHDLFLRQLPQHDPPIDWTALPVTRWMPGPQGDENVVRGDNGSNGFDVYGD